MTIEDQIRSLTRKEVQVLYWRCKGEQNKQIAFRYDKTSDKWAEGIMTGVYVKLGIDKRSTKLERLDYLNNEVCGIVQRLIGDDEDNLERWPLYGVNASVQRKGVVIYTEKEKDDSVGEPDSEILSIVLADQGKEERPVPDPPIIKIDRQERRRPSLLLIGLGAVVLSIGICIVIFGNRVMQALAPQSTPTVEATNTSIPLPTHSPTWTPDITSTRDVTFTPDATFTPENTATPAISPTPVSLPIREDFSGPYSNLWRVIGEPFVAENNINADYSGVLTTRPGETGTLLIGNSAWRDYSISFTSFGGLGGGRVIIGFRVIDLNNMILLDCQTNNSRCDWIVVSDGQFDMLIENQFLFLRDSVTLNVQGDTFRAVASSFGDTNTMLLDLPPQYKGKFSSGGIMLRVVDQASVDFIEIQPFP